MAEAIVSGLNGHEIIEDLTNIIRNRLRRDCRLTPTDSYSRGYSATINLKLELYGIDKEEVETEVKVGFQNPEETDKLVVEEKIEVPVEGELNTVRERSGLEEPVLTVDSEGKPQIHKRKYTRRIVTNAAEASVEGGAVDFAE